MCQLILTISQYSGMDELRNQLKTMNRQFRLLHEAQDGYEE